VGCAGFGDRVALAVDLPALLPHIGAVLGVIMFGMGMTLSLADFERVVALFLSILQIVLVPVILGVVAQRYFKKAVAKGIEIMPLLSVTAIVAIVGAIVGRNAELGPGRCPRRDSLQSRRCRPCRALQCLAQCHGAPARDDMGEARRGRVSAPCTGTAIMTGCVGSRFLLRRDPGRSERFVFETS